MTFYCPSCWVERAGTEDKRPACGANLQDLGTESYEEKLIHALRHPEPTVPLRAAMILGKPRLKSAVIPLIEAAERSNDPYLQEAVVEALGAIGDERSLPCLERLSREEALRVRVAGQRSIDRTGKHADQKQ